MKKNLIKRLMVLSLSALMLFSATACECNPSSAKIDVWTASGIEKILRDEDYSSRYTDKTLKIGVFRNETEGGQIILSTDKTVKSYEITLNDLKLTTDSNITLSKDCFEVFNQKYINLDRIKEQQIETAGGWYPDALLPWDTAVEYKENTITDGKNQGLWINVCPDKDQTAGVYKGSFTVVADNQTISVPVEVTVYNHTLSDTTHVRSTYGINWDYVAMGELDATVEMQEAYYEYMLEHRVNTFTLPGSYSSMYFEDNDAFIAKFLKRTHKAYEDPRSNYYNMPYKVTTIYDENGTAISSLNFDFMTQLFQEMAKYSVENDVDLFEKMDVYLVFCDEFNASAGTEKLRNASYTLDRYWTYIHDDLTEDLLFAKVEGEIDGAVKEKLLASAKGVSPMIPGQAEGLDTENYPNAKLIPCDVVRYMDSAERREWYKDYVQTAYGETWWYQATSSYPSVSYQIETPVVSPRSNGWMMYDYGIDGDLYWECAINFQFTQSYEIEYTQTQYDLIMRYPGHTGDGKLLYAGREYGIYGPVGTIRMEAIRDAHEDYDLLYELEELYAERGVTSEEFNSIYQFLVEGLYTNTTLSNPTNQAASIAIMQNAREMLATLYDLYYTNGVVLHSYEEAKDAATLILSATNGTDVSINGNKLNGTDKDGYVLYEFTTKLTQNSNVLKISTKKGNSTLGIELELGGKKSIVELSKLSDKITAQIDKDSNEESAVIEIDNAVGAYKVSLKDGINAVVKLDTKKLSIDASKSSVAVRIYVYGEDNVSVTLRCKCVNEKGIRPLSTYTLRSGWNEIVLDVATQLKCNTNGSLDYLRLDATAGSGSFGIGEIILEDVSV